MIGVVLTDSGMSSVDSAETRTRRLSWRGNETIKASIAEAIKTLGDEQIEIDGWEG